MTTDRDNERVANTYREIAKETTRPELDEKILKLAAGDVRPKYSVTRAWTRPLAWAATIALAVALVLQVTQDVDEPTFAPVESSEPAAADPAALEERSRNDVELLKVKEEKDMQREAAKRTPYIAQPARVQESELGVAADSAVAREPDEETLDSDADAAIEVQAFRATAEALAVPPGCRDDVRASAETWFACVENMRLQGLEERADAEMEALREAFPDFDPTGE